mmetsp:Transcript_22887/g.53084  ORF Transcript_22887/g.53084 Transcript_22887/m.53084 type:complete len:95 (+) Transcript_22887:54-338(+)|eukprot:CAMPEP_0119485852 /NCGR_PEP_ID=MMETSP1344-20130328/12425_1 /TAXON_ID=236787 /ORGANISM="Florenciella parvula, Strain CCMP2471" /LENGTH=94 /DNA_ID=CAMNT_0007520553 /DNA_START=207 /DNA_END=491 /DNA_ORIENTATION=+
MTNASDQGLSLLCNDQDGLCVVATGDADPANSKLFTALIKNVSALNPAEIPTVTIETDTRTIIVKEYDNLTVAVHHPNETAGTDGEVDGDPNQA